MTEDNIIFLFSIWANNPYIIVNIKTVKRKKIGLEKIMIFF